MLQTLTELLQARAVDSAALGYKYLRDGAVSEQLDYAGLDRAARAAAARLQAAGVSKGTPVLLLYPPGIEFIVGLFGCMYAGAIAVPVYPPNPARLARTLPRLRAIARDLEATLVLTSAEVKAMAEGIFPLAPELSAATWIATDEPGADPSAYRSVSASSSDLVILQYTSGSTREPRGVMLSHANLLHNMRAIVEGFRIDAGPHNTWVSWLPVYHDMGLIANTLTPVLLGGNAVHMSPTDFLYDPHRWISALSEYRANVTGAPNFAYELCTRKLTDEQLAKLDLSALKVAYCGAEPVRKATLERFTSRFEPAGFRSSAWLPCYGLAEGTLIVSGTLRTDGLATLDVDDVALREGKIVARDGDRTTNIVSCGCPTLGAQDTAIVAGDRRCGPRELGEIWVRGPSVAGGYWKRDEDTVATFGAKLADGTGPFLRTGDIGFLDENGELYICGRVKDLLIVRGLNYYPHDLEAAAESAWATLRPGCSAAFALDGDDKDDVAIVCEYEAKAAHDGVNLEAIVDAVRSAIAIEFELGIRSIAIVKPGQVPKTTSGKIQRSETRRRYLAGELEVLHEAKTPNIGPLLVNPVTLDSVEAIERYLTSWLSERLHRQVTSDAQFSMIGLDSLDSVRMIDAVGELIGRELNPELAISFPTAAELARQLAPVRKRG